MKRIHGILLFIAMWLLMESRFLLLVHWPFFYMKVNCSFNPCLAVLILYASPFPLLCGCMNPHQRWTMHLSFVDMVAGFFFLPPKHRDLPIFEWVHGLWQCGNVSKLYECGHSNMQLPLSFFNGATYLSSYGASCRDILWWCRLFPLKVATHSEMCWTLRPLYAERQPVFSFRKSGHRPLYILSGACLF